MHYVKNATAVTDVPLTLAALMKQRRRWCVSFRLRLGGEWVMHPAVSYLSYQLIRLNGSLFAMVYALRNFELIWSRTAHSLPMKMLLTFQFFYFLFNQILGFLLPGLFFLTLLFVVRTRHTSLYSFAFCPLLPADPVTYYLSVFPFSRVKVQPAIGGDLALVGSFVYLVMLFIQLIMSLGNFELKSVSIVKTFEVTSAILSLITLASFALFRLKLR